MPVTELHRNLHCPEAPFTAPLHLRNPHVQTLLPHLCPTREPLPLRWQCLTTRDGTTADLAWHGVPLAKTGELRPLVILLTGLEGSAHSSYMRHLVKRAAGEGCEAVVLHFRSCGRTPGQWPLGYHAGYTADLEELVRHVSIGPVRRPLAAVGVSLGGNVLLKWLGESSLANRLAAAVTVSAPVSLATAARDLERGFARVYHGYLLARLKAKMRAHAQGGALAIAPAALRACRSFWEFDDLVTAPLNGFRDADDYYRRSSARPFLSRIPTPTLMLHAQDDPFMGPEGLPTPGELSPSVILELARHGGHVGFYKPPCPRLGQSWLAGRIFAFLRTWLPVQPEVGAGPSRQR